LPLRLLVPLQIFLFGVLSVLVSATCGALDKIGDSDFYLLSVAILVGLVSLFVPRFLQDAETLTHS